MKTTVFFVHLLLSAGYPAALAAELFGLLPANTLSLPTFLGVYVTTGVLAVAFLDYVKKPSARTQAETALPRPARMKPAAAPHVANPWRCRPASA